MANLAEYIEAHRDTRHIAWFSCGVPSAINAKLVVEQYGSRAAVVNCDMRQDEHDDNERFLLECQNWLGVEIVRVSNPRYQTVDDVFVAQRYMSGVKGARCTVEMKKIPRFAFQRPDDVHSFGYSIDEMDRITRFTHDNPELFLEWPLIANGLSKSDCFGLLERASIRPSAMYAHGFKNANCFGCVKSKSAPYWNRVRRVRPDVFALRAARSRELGVRLVEVKGVRIFLDELTPEMGKQEPEPEISCGPQCVS